ncbi:MAG: chemotaxis-specific protein-glutamate methyltransferase CheB [Spirochaetes bacterium]|nr:chemotaxis-specific protein-glutamate methyltransferase CheB [Spirochaetota bacterium]
MIKVLIVEDSAVTRDFLQYVMSNDRDIEVMGCANDGEAAVEMIQDLDPDVVTMDINMPRMNGFEATKRIMEIHPVPIIIMSASWNPDEVRKTFLAMEAGAVAIIEKPRGFGSPDNDVMTKRLLRTVKLMSEVKVVKRWSKKTAVKGETPPAAPGAGGSMQRKLALQLVAIGASTGGPSVLKEIFSILPSDLPVPFLIVQHIATGFLKGLVDWLVESTGFPLRIAQDGERAHAGYGYMCPEHRNIAINRSGSIVLSETANDRSRLPSVSHLFTAALKAYGSGALGVLLTGMGKDGAEELKKMRDRGAITIVQNKESSVVWGMPGEAVRLDGARYILAPAEIARTIAALFKDT